MKETEIGISKTENHAVLPDIEKKLALLIINTVESFVLVDTDFRIITFNTAYERQFNKLFNRQIKRGDSIINFSEVRSQHESIEIYNKVFKGETINSEVKLTYPDNTIHTYSVLYKPALDDTGNIFGAFVTTYNITQSEQNKAAHIQLYDKLNRKAEALSQSNEELEQFAYIASHDLQEPLRMVSSFMSLLESEYKEQLDDKAKEYIHFAADGAARMRKIILDLLEYSKIGKKEYKYEEIDVNKLMDEVLQLNKSTINDKNAKVTWDKLPKIYGFKSPLLQLFHNLIANALNYQLPHTQPLITVTSEEHIDFWQFAIKDNGIGIQSQFLDKIFVLFKRLHQKDKYPGTGMGLAICKKIIETHHGKIWAESVVGEGTIFYFNIKKRIINRYNYN